MAISTHEKVEGPERVHHQAVGRSGGMGKRRTAKPQTPMTPMIDVTFQLLLFFIMTFEFRQSEGMIPGTLPVIDDGLITRADPPVGAGPDPYSPDSLGGPAVGQLRDVGNPCGDQESR